MKVMVDIKKLCPRTELVMPFNGHITGFRSAFLIRLLQFVKEILGWRPGCIEIERTEKVQREKRETEVRRREGKERGSAWCCLY